MSHCQTKEYEKGSILKKEGEQGKMAFFIQEGEVVVKKSSSEGEMDVAIINSEEICFSLTCLIDGGESLTTVEAVKKTKVILIEQKSFFDLCRKEPALGVKILANVAKLMAGFLRNADDKIAQMYKTLEEVL